MHDIPLELIRSSDQNARKSFSSTVIFERAESLRNHGQIEAAIVHPIEQDLAGHLFELIEGELRLRAFRTIDGATTIRCEVQEVDNEEDAHTRMFYHAREQHGVESDRTGRGLGASKAFDRADRRAARGEVRQDGSRTLDP